MGFWTGLWLFWIADSISDLVRHFRKTRERESAEKRVQNKIQLILARVEILKLKANVHDWSCYVPAPVKESLEQTLKEIETMLGCDQEGALDEAQQN